MNSPNDGSPEGASAQEESVRRTLREGPPRHIGIIAGNGRFPIDIAREATQRGHSVFAVAHRGETDERIHTVASEVRWVRVGQLGAMLRFLKGKGVSHAVMAGGISRIRLFGGARPDLAAIRLVARLGTLKDDVLLRGIVAEIERAGIVVFGAEVFLPEAIPEAGVLTTRKCSAQEQRDAMVGWEAAHAIGRLDIGQTVVVCDGLVVAVEAVEGTDATIRRAGHLIRGEALVAAGDVSEVDGPGRSESTGSGARRSQRAARAVVVKCAKPQQDLRVDLPTVGVATVESMVAAGASALVIEAGKTLLLQPAEVVSAANRAGIAIVATNSINELKSL